MQRCFLGKVVVSNKAAARDFFSELDFFLVTQLRKARGISSPNVEEASLLEFEPSLGVRFYRD